MLTEEQALTSRRDVPRPVFAELLAVGQEVLGTMSPDDLAVFEIVPEVEGTGVDYVRWTSAAKALFASITGNSRSVRAALQTVNESGVPILPALFDAAGACADFIKTDEPFNPYNLCRSPSYIDFHKNADVLVLELSQKGVDVKNLASIIDRLKGAFGDVDLFHAQQEVRRMTGVDVVVDDNILSKTRMIQTDILMFEQELHKVSGAVGKINLSSEKERYFESIVGGLRKSIAGIKDALLNPSSGLGNSDRRLVVLRRRPVPA